MSNLPMDMSKIPTSVSNNVNTDSPFTARLQLIHATSGVRTEWESEEAAPVEGTFFMGPPGALKMGKSINVIPIGWRDHALQIKGSEVSAESFKAPARGSPPQDMDEEVFAMIQNGGKGDAKKGLNRVGKDVLFFVLCDGDGKLVQKFAIYFFNGTARPEASNAFAFRGKKCTMVSHKISTASFQWYVPQLTVDGDGSLSRDQFPEIPNDVIMIEEMTKFLNPSPKGRADESTTTTPTGNPR